MNQVTKICVCGCGKPCKNIWRKGHHARSPEYRAAARARIPKMEKAFNWRGGRTLKNGYVMIRTKDRGYVPEHVLIIEKVLGRRLKYFGQSHRDNETVHHVNGVKTDNQNRNLLVCTHGYHVTLHHRMRRVA